NVLGVGRSFRAGESHRPQHATPGRGIGPGAREARLPESPSRPRSRPSRWPDALDADGIPARVFRPGTGTNGTAMRSGGDHVPRLDCSWPVLQERPARVAWLSYGLRYHLTVSRFNGKVLRGAKRASGSTFVQRSGQRGMIMQGDNAAAKQ